MRTGLGPGEAGVAMEADDVRVERLLAERLPRRLGLAMRTRGMSQASLAKASRVSPASLSFILAGRRLPRLATTLRLVDALDVSLEWLVGMDVRPDGCLKPARKGRVPFAPGRHVTRQGEMGHGDG